MIQLNRREKTLVQILIGFVLIIAIYFLIITPLIEFTGDTGTEQEQSLNDLQRLERIYTQYRSIQEKKSKYTSLLDKKNENITTLVEQWANNAGISGNIAYTRRNQSNIQNKYIRITTEIKFDGVAIQSFMKFLYEVESSNSLLKVSYLRINRALKGTNTYDINIKIDTFTLK